MYAATPDLSVEPASGRTLVVLAELSANEIVRAFGGDVTVMATVAGADWICPSFAA